MLKRNNFASLCMWQNGGDAQKRADYTDLIILGAVLAELNLGSLNLNRRFTS